MYILISVWYPPTKSMEVGKKYIEATQKFPEDETIYKTILEGGIMRTKNGIKAIQIHEILEGKLEEAFTRFNEVLQFFAEIEGFNSRIDTMGTVAEAMEVIGLAIPVPA
ncbi:MAG: hypothetical protein ACFFFT_03770 [Candidatus Thorarchaeota archaeon]